MKRVLLKSALALGAIMLAALVVAAGVLLWAARSESGMQFVWQRVAPRLPAGVSVATVEGRLAGPLVFGGVAVQTETLELRVERVELRWNPRALLERTFDVERLDVRGVDIVRLPAERPAATASRSGCPKSIDLPVDIRVASASVEELRFRPNPNAEPLSIERASLAGGLDADRLELDELVVSGPLFDVSGEANVVPRDAYETSGRLDWVLRPGEYPEAHGSTRFPVISRRSRSSRASKRRTTRASICASGAADGAAPRRRGCVHGAAGSVRHRAGAGGDGRLHAVAPRHARRARADRARGARGGEADGVAADIAARYAGGAVEIHALDLVDAGSRAAMHASGRVALGAEQPVLELAATWTELQWPLRGAPQVASDSGSLELRGTLHDYAVALDGNLALADGTNGKVSVSGTGNAETLNLDRVDIEALRGRIAGRMNARWAPNLSAAIE